MIYKNCTIMAIECLCVKKRTETSMRIVHIVIAPNEEVEIEEIIHVIDMSYVTEMERNERKTDETDRPSSSRN